MDIFSRYIVAWLLADRQADELAQTLIAETCLKQGIDPHQLTLHADRGGPMPSKTVTELLPDLHVTNTHTRPYTPDDNPYSEAQFKTMKYRPDYPDRFASFRAAHTWPRTFIDWYNNDHHHSRLALMTPAVVHYGLVEYIRTQPQQVLQAAYQAHPERFVRGQPTPPQLPVKVWINQPGSDPETTVNSQ